MVALIQSENYATNKGETAGRYQFDTHQNRNRVKGGGGVTKLKRRKFHFLSNPSLMQLCYTYQAYKGYFRTNIRYREKSKLRIIRIRDEI